MICEHRGDLLTLNRDEVKELKSLLENCSTSGSPFARGEFVTSDFEALGLDVQGGGTSKSRGNDRSNAPADLDDADFLPTHIALIAPDFTPAAAEPIPHETARQVLKEPEAPVAPQPAAASQPPKMPFTIEPGEPELGGGMSESELTAQVASMVMHGAPQRKRKKEAVLDESVPANLRSKINAL